MAAKLQKDAVQGSASQPDSQDYQASKREAPQPERQDDASSPEKSGVIPAARIILQAAILTQEAEPRTAAQP